MTETTEELYERIEALLAENDYLKDKLEHMEQLEDNERDYEYNRGFDAGYSQGAEANFYE